MLVYNIIIGHGIEHAYVMQYVYNIVFRIYPTYNIYIYNICIYILYIIYTQRMYIYTCVID